MSDQTFCPSCLLEQAPDRTQCVRCKLSLTEPEMPRLHQIFLERKVLDGEWSQLVASYWARLKPAKVEAEAYSRQSHPRPVAPRKEWTPKRVQNLLLSLGALLCALAALLFVAVTWSHIGINGRAAIMLSVTAVTAVGAQLALKRGLKSTAEAVTGIAYSLALLDFASAYSLDLFGLSAMPWWQYWTFALVALTAVGAIHRELSKIDLPAYAALGFAQLPIPFVLIGTEASPTAWIVGMGIQALCLVMISDAVAERDDLPGMSELAFGIASVIGMGISYAALALAASRDSNVDSIAPLALVGGFAIAGAYLGGKRTLSVRLGSITTAVVAITIDAGAVIVRETDSSVWALGLVLLGAVITAAAIAVRQPKLRLMAVGISAVGVGLAFTLPTLGALAANTLTWMSQIWTATDWSTQMAMTDKGSVALALGVAGLTFLATGRKEGRIAAVITAAIAVDLLLVVLDVPFALALSVLTAAAAATLVVTHFSIKDADMRITLFSVGGVLAAQALCWSLATDTSTIAVLIIATVVSGGVAIFDNKTLPVTGALASFFFLALVGAECAVAALDASVTGVVLLVAGEAIAVAASLINRKDTGSILMVALAASGIGFVMTVVDTELLSVSLAVSATATAIVSSTKRDSLLGWVSSGFVLCLIWLRLSMASVETVEAYTLPLAALALYAGYLAWRKPEHITSSEAFGWGLAIAFGPSLVALANDTTAPRAFVLLLAGLGTVLYGARLRMRALLVAGAITLVSSILITEGPYLHEIPRWFAIGTAGVILVAVGATWEARRRDFQAAKARFDKLT